MKHPFIHDLSGKSLEELQQTLSGLLTKLTFAHRTGNSPLISQIQMAMESYRAETTKRMDEMLEKQNTKTKVTVEKRG